MKIILTASEVEEIVKSWAAKIYQVSNVSRLEDGSYEIVTSSIHQVKKTAPKKTPSDDYG